MAERVLVPVEELVEVAVAEAEEEPVEMEISTLARLPGKDADTAPMRALANWGVAPVEDTKEREVEEGPYTM